MADHPKFPGKGLDLPVGSKVEFDDGRVWVMTDHGWEYDYNAYEAWPRYGAAMKALQSNG